jgi:hypothetical protein
MTEIVKRVNLSCSQARHHLRRQSKSLAALAGPSFGLLNDSDKSPDSVRRLPLSPLELAIAVFA